MTINEQFTATGALMLIPGVVAGIVVLCLWSSSYRGQPLSVKVSAALGIAFVTLALIFWLVAVWVQ